MKKVNKVRKWFLQNLEWLVLLLASLVCLGFLVAGHPAEDGSITLDGSNAKISESTEKFIEDAKDAMWRIMNEDAPTDETVIKEYENGFEGDEGLGGSATLDTVIARRRPDGDNDDGRGWQCSKYTAYLATGKKDYSSAHPDYGPVNGKNVAQWLHDNFGWKYVDTPVKGAIGSGGFNTLYGHTAMFLYYTGEHTAMVNDANYVPLTVATHNMNIDGWVWVVPGDWTPDPEPTPTPEPTPNPEPVPDGEATYSYVPGDYFSKVLVNLGLDEGHLWGDTGTVRYYTAQLVEQNVLDANGNVKLYTPFTLRRR